MTLNLKALSHDKRVQYGAVAVAAGAGGLVWYRRSKAGGSAAAATSADGSDSTTPTAYAPGAFPDTSSTDIASWLGDNEAAFLRELADYQSSLQTATPAPPTTPSPVPVHTRPGTGPYAPPGVPFHGRPITTGSSGISMSYTPAGVVASVRSRLGMATAAAQPTVTARPTIQPGSSIRLT